MDSHSSPGLKPWGFLLNFDKLGSELSSENPDINLITTLTSFLTHLNHQVIVRLLTEDKVAEAITDTADLAKFYKESIWKQIKAYLKIPLLDDSTLFKTQPGTISSFVRIIENNEGYKALTLESPLKIFINQALPPKNLFVTYDLKTKANAAAKKVSTERSAEKKSITTESRVPATTPNQIPNQTTEQQTK